MQRIWLNDGKPWIAIEAELEPKTGTVGTRHFDAVVLKGADPVEIEGVALRGATWTFRAHVRNEQNGAESVEVLGGRPGDHRVRSFLPGQVFPAGARKTGKPSLEAAPQLPLG